MAFLLQFLKLYTRSETMQLDMLSVFSHSDIAKAFFLYMLTMMVDFLKTGLCMLETLHNCQVYYFARNSKNYIFYHSNKSMLFVGLFTQNSCQFLGRKGGPRKHLAFLI